jgi:ATPase subunit of ABC transporter with duplicated ATPase domains
VRQSCEVIDAVVEQLAICETRDARRWRARFALAPAEFERFATLSPGQQRRWQLAAAFFDEPEILLLDEPTNHLDEIGREVLIAELAGFAGTGLVISHDRAFLEQVTRRTLRVRNGKAELFEGSYEKARSVWEERRAASIRQQGALKSEVARSRASLAHAREERARADRSRSAQHRMRNRNDSDARSVGEATRAAWAEARRGRDVEVRRRERQRAEAALAEVSIEPELGGRVFARWRPAPSPILAHREAGPLRAGPRVLGELPALLIERDTRVWLSGKNGAGKTSLLRELVAGLRCPRGRVLLLEQELTAEVNRATIEQLRGLPPEVRGRVLSIVAALGTDPSRLLATESPSPGEARKLSLALALGTEAWLLLLDEPTNHLDLPAIERLQAMLVDYPGAIVLITHDEMLGRAAARSRWTLDEGALRVSVGTC